MKISNSLVGNQQQKNPSTSHVQFVLWI